MRENWWKQSVQLWETSVVRASTIQANMITVLNVHKFKNPSRKEKKKEEELLHIFQFKKSGLHEITTVTDLHVLLFLFSTSHLCLSSHFHLSSLLFHISTLFLFSMKMKVITGSARSLCALGATLHGPWPFRCLARSSLGTTVQQYLLRTGAT